MTEERYLDLLFIFSRHLPGLGGIGGLDALTLEQAHGLMRRLNDELERVRAGIKGD